RKLFSLLASAGAHRQSVTAQPASRGRGLGVALLRQRNAFWHFAPEKRCPVLLIPQIHLEANPLAVLENAHPPRPFDGVRELPKYVIPFFVRKAFSIRLKDAAYLREYRVFDFAED